MPGPNPSPEPVRRGDARLADLAASVDALRADLDDLRASLATEIRTQRVVLTADDGFERLVASATDRSAGMSLYCRTDDDDPTCMDIFANDPVDATGSHVGVALTVRGDVVAAIDAVGGERANVWIDERH